MSTVYVNGAMPVVAFEQLSVTSTSAPVSPTGTTIASKGADSLVVGTSVNDNAFTPTYKVDEAFLMVATDIVRMRFDGGAPTSTSGHQLITNDSMVISGYTNIKNLQFVKDATATGTPTVSITYFRRQG